MCEDDNNSAKNGVTNDVLIGDNNVVDLKKNVYEGGFKSWECSYDMVDELSTMINNGKLNYNNLLEFGCGTALPTCFLFMKRFQTQDKTGANYILSDFNYDVLRLYPIHYSLGIHFRTIEIARIMCIPVGGRSKHRNRCSNVKQRRSVDNGGLDPRICEPVV